MSKSRKKRARDAWNRFGDTGRSVLVGAATLLPHRSETDRISAGACLIAVKMISKGLKTVVPEPRPDGDGDDSFPSEHAAQCTAAAIIIEREYPGKIGAIAYALATVVALSRIEGRKHHPRDVAAGALIGCAAVWVALKLNARMRSLRSISKGLSALSGA